MKVYTNNLFVSEHQIASAIAELANQPCQKIDPITDGLLHNQSDAVLNACNKSISVLTGMAGTGKTTTLNKVITSLQDAGMKGAVCAPTGKAAKRADELVNEDRKTKVTCSTTHRFLRYNPMTGKFTFNEDKKLEVDYVVVDEFPMCGTRLFCSLMKAIDPKRTRVILTGDPNQLPSIDPGNIGSDIINCGLLPVTSLTKIIRQDDSSGIVFNSRRVIEGGKLSLIAPEGGKFKDFFWIPTDSDDRSLEMCISAVKRAVQIGIEKEEIQVIAPGKLGPVGVTNLNKECRGILNPTAEDEGHKFSIGDKVVNSVNDYENEIVNGDIGVVTDSEKGVYTVKFSGLDREIEFSGDKVNDIYLAYSYTVHKSQGSEFGCVVYPLSNQHWTLHSRNILYTGITRAKRLCVLVGSKKSLGYSIRNNNPVKRTTGLIQLIRSYNEKAA